MPNGIPVATVALNASQNAGILAAQIIGAFDNSIAENLEVFKKNLETESFKVCRRDLRSSYSCLIIYYLYSLNHNQCALIQLHNKKFKPFITKEEINSAVLKMAEKIQSDYEGMNPVFIGVLNGSFLIVADLVRRIYWKL